MPTLHSHTHCQVAPADPQAKTWQREYLSHRTTDRQSGRKKEQRNANSMYVAIAGAVSGLKYSEIPHYANVPRSSESAMLISLHAVNGMMEPTHRSRLTGGASNHPKVHW
ncbi:hypothetical protein [Pleomorphovibrio marinus]|uniref:hypothetical protein n=1 Tax=Pleomorphovibrio marinus TaxID=2164132 RepID=UPI000E0B32D3|nr:hypothetical protein [Pleomorphovibrio marinus]